MKKQFRLLKNDDFQRVIKGSYVVSSSSLMLYRLANSLGHVRVGISLSKKIGHAVVRNYYRRQLRMMVQPIFATTDSSDYVILIRRDFTTKTYAENNQSLESLYRRMQDRLRGEINEKI